MIQRLAAALLSTLTVGLVSFFLLEHWAGAAFDGRARTVLLPFFVVGASALAVSAWLSRRIDGHTWPGPLMVGVVWFTEWQYLFWRSLQVHG